MTAPKNMIVRCPSIEDFFQCIEKFVERGLTFEAQVDELTIYLTGGY